MKKCKQCGNNKADECFRPYVPRGRGINKSTVGRNTICLDCERTNRNIDRAWKSEFKTDKDNELLALAEEYYKKLILMGLDPIGVYCKHIREDVLRYPANQNTGLHANHVNTIDSLQKDLSTMNVDVVVLEFNRLLSMDLTEEPDVYNEMLENLEAKCQGLGGKVLDKYREIDLKVITRLADYEDNYKWD